MSYQEQVIEWYKSLQDNICAGLEKADGLAKFQEDNWSRPEGGGGRSRVIQDGNVFEKGGVNFSAVHGVLPDTIKKALGVSKSDFFGILLNLWIISDWFFSLNSLSKFNK